jgi:hypothetical protein
MKQSVDLLVDPEREFVSPLLREEPKNWQRDQKQVILSVTLIKSSTGKAQMS